MLCDHCGKNEATVHMVYSMNGVQKEYNLCEECRAKMTGTVNPFSIANLFSGFMQPEYHRQPVQACEQCGWTEENLRETGRVGCAHCYEVFRELLNPVLKSAQKSLKHIGKDGGADPALIEKRRREAQLREQIEQAVKREDYEQAAVLRDELKKLN